MLSIYGNSLDSHIDEWIGVEGLYWYAKSLDLNLAESILTEFELRITARLLPHG